MKLSRRGLLTGTAGLVLAGMAPSVTMAAGQKVLRTETRQIEVAGRAATRYGLSDGSGAFGLTLDEGDMFDVRLENGLKVPTSIHWHGLTPPWRQDGVPYVSQPPIPPGGHFDYNFPATPSGTRFMHSHFRLQEQDTLAAPLIIREASLKGRDVQEVVVLLGDFSGRLRRRSSRSCASRRMPTPRRCIWTMAVPISTMSSMTPISPMTAP